MRFRFFVFAVALEVLGAPLGVQARPQVQECDTTPEPEVDSPDVLARWSQENKQAALRTLFVAPGLACPRLLEGNVNNLAWQDSADISLDGDVVSFMEASLDPLAWEVTGGADPAQLPFFQRGPARSRNPAWAVRFYNSALNSNQQACQATLFPFTSGTLWEWGGQRAKDGTWTYVAVDPNDDYDPDIYQNGVRLSFDTPFLEDDPHYDSDTGELFFWSSDLPGGGGTETIWMTRRIGDNEWDTPFPLSEPVNLRDSNQRQPHLSPDGHLYYSSSELDPGSGALSIYRVTRLAENAWGDKERLLGPPTTIPSLDVVVAAVGEPTLASNGTLTFVVVFFHVSANEYDADVAITTPGVCPPIRVSPVSARQ